MGFGGEAGDNLARIERMDSADVDLRSTLAGFLHPQGVKGLLPLVVYRY